MSVRARVLCVFYSFISFSRRAKTNFIGTISRVCIRLFLATCWLNIEMTSWYHGLVYAMNVRNYVFYREYLQSDEWMSNLCKRAKRTKRAMSRLKNQILRKEQEWLELVMELSRESTLLSTSSKHSIWHSSQCSILNDSFCILYSPVTEPFLVVWPPK